MSSLDITGLYTQVSLAAPRTGAGAGAAHVAGRAVLVQFVDVPGDQGAVEFSVHRRGILLRGCGAGEQAQERGGKSGKRVRFNPLI